MKLRLQTLSLLFMALFLSCEQDELNQESIEQNYFLVSEYNVDKNAQSRESLDDPCIVVDLIAGQNTVVGTVTIDRTETDLVLTYTTIEGWEINLTHMSIGDCNEQWAPETGSGNPKVGKFEHTEPHSTNINEVVYRISLDVLPDYTDLYCFAAHAEVIGSNGGETAWAGSLLGENEDEQTEGYTVRDFDGRNWAMYIEAEQSACDIDDGGSNDR
ncbi:hypothetical protein [Winogradskyella immobilis]|uniref:Lipoprotein n=1 Tax=Winogradskyella immobilis TaxID=2816852 RepID=A0ABS8EQE3_9FLAO|nr:hypothetical protein [Winogradskyella immobilis]MCC1485459.1 hypothetical protein [Winogradskyella immobilis]MCG0017551.1 hypothetical protein [Winogradskyella immobilis]